jgi:hypothetical protein
MVIISFQRSALKIASMFFTVGCEKYQAPAQNSGRVAMAES